MTEKKPSKSEVDSSAVEVPNNQEQETAQARDAEQIQNKEQAQGEEQAQASEQGAKETPASEQDTKQTPTSEQDAGQTQVNKQGAKQTPASEEGAGHTQEKNSVQEPNQAKGASEGQDSEEDTEQDPDSEGISLSDYIHNLPSKTKKRIIRGVEITLGIIAVILIICCIFALLSNGETVQARVNCPDWTSSASKTELALYNYDAKEVLTDGDPSNDPQPKIITRIQPNEDKVLNDIISSGTYTIAVYTTPVLEDGTTFKTPEPQVIEFKGESLKVEFNLEKN